MKPSKPQNPHTKFSPDYWQWFGRFGAQGGSRNTPAQQAARGKNAASATKAWKKIARARRKGAR